MAQREVNDAGLDLIKSFEGLMDGDPRTVKLDPYMDPVQIWTIGWGHALSQGGHFLTGEQDRPLANACFPGGLTVDQAEALLRTDLLATSQVVQQAVRVPLTDNEFSALVSFTFNVGGGNFRSSTLLRLLNQDDRWGAAGQFGRWVLAKGQRFEGLVRRRAAERDLFVTPP